MPHLKQRQGWRGDVLLLELENGHAFRIAPAPGNLTQQLPTSCNSSSRVRLDSGGRTLTNRLNRVSPRRGKGKISLSSDFRPGYRQGRLNDEDRCHRRHRPAAPRRRHSAPARSRRRCFAPKRLNTITGEGLEEVLALPRRGKGLMCVRTIPPISLACSSHLAGSWTIVQKQPDLV